MSTKDISDKQVVEAYTRRRRDNLKPWPHELLAQETGQPKKVCYAACERALRRGFVDCGVSLETGWATTRGIALLEAP